MHQISVTAPRRAVMVSTGLAVAGLLLVTACANDEPTAPEPQVSVTETATAEPTVEPDPEPQFDRKQHSTDDPTSIWVVSNKARPLDPIDFHPADLVMPEGVENEFTQPLREPAARAVEAMHQAAVTADVPFRIISAYRDYPTQVSLYNTYVTRDGQALADTYSARPGHSEHQTGLVVDLDDWGSCYLKACFGESPAGAWLRDNAAEYGFIIRYPDGLDHITGFTFEPWHFRYVGVELALEMRDTDTQTLEEFFELPPAPGYAS